MNFGSLGKEIKKLFVGRATQGTFQRMFPVETRRVDGGLGRATERKLCLDLRGKGGRKDMCRASQGIFQKTLLVEKAALTGRVSEYFKREI